MPPQSKKQKMDGAKSAASAVTLPSEPRTETPQTLQVVEAPSDAASGAAGSGAPDAASGARGDATVPSMLSFTALLEMDSVESHVGEIARWSVQTRDYVDKNILDLLGSHRAITAAASGASVSAFREVMNFDNLKASFAK